MKDDNQEKKHLFDSLIKILFFQDSNNQTIFAPFSLYWKAYVIENDEQLVEMKNYLNNIFKIIFALGIYFGMISEYKYTFVLYLALIPIYLFLVVWKVSKLGINKYK